MITFVRSVFLCITIWVLTGILSGLLTGSCLMFIQSSTELWPGIVLFVGLFTMAFSIPGMFVFLLIVIWNWNSPALFRIMLRCAAMLPLLSTSLLYLFPMGLDRNEFSVISIGVTISCLTSVMLHHSIIKSINENNISHA